MIFEICVHVALHVRFLCIPMHNRMLFCYMWTLVHCWCNGKIMCYIPHTFLSFLSIVMSHDINSCWRADVVHVCIFIHELLNFNQLSHFVSISFLILSVVMETIGPGGRYNVQFGKECVIQQSSHPDCELFLNRLLITVIPNTPKHAHWFF